MTTPPVALMRECRLSQYNSPRKATWASLGHRGNAFFLVLVSAGLKREGRVKAQADF